ncbi:hypothetical protein EX30DRAFT_375220, partial [Ascodesmis nigricans]
LFDHSFGPTGLPSIAVARKRAAEESRLWSSESAVEIASPAQQNASTTTPTDTAQPPTNNPLPTEQNQQDVRKNERARKRPHSAGDLVEDCSIAELQELVKKAIQEATNPLKMEIQTLKATIERLSGCVQELNCEEGVQTRTSPQTTTPNTPERSLPNNITGELTQEEAINHLSWAQVAASPGQARAATPSFRQWQVVSRKNGRLDQSAQAGSNKTGDLKPPKRVADRDRRLIIQKPNGMEVRHGPELVVALNATLQKSGAAAHIRVQRVDINAKGTATLHGVSLERYYQPIENKEGLKKLKEDIKNAYPTIDMPTNPKWLLRAEKLEERSHTVAHSFVIITLRNKKDAEWICRRGLWIYGKHHSADKFLSAGPDAFCETCSGWGHAAHRSERATKPACMLCGNERP